jgi:putative membrane protein
MAETPSFEIKPNVSDHFAWLRTYMSIQNTQLSVVRTATTLIGFGFTVAQFFQKLKEVPGALGSIHPELPRNIGLLLIASGVFALIAFTWHYRIAMAYLRSAPFEKIAVQQERKLRKPAYFVTFVVLAVGIVAFASIFVTF